MKRSFFTAIHENPIIAAVRDLSSLHRAVQSPCGIVFLLHAGISDLPRRVELVRTSGKEIYIHFDLMEGFSQNMAALSYIRETSPPDGIITTKSSLVKAARELGFFVIQRFFILDSQSVETGIKAVLGTRPDAVEILPGLIPRVISKIGRETGVPVIAGGLIETKEDVIANIKAGAVGVSVSREVIWEL